MILSNTPAAQPQYERSGPGWHEYLVSVPAGTEITAEWLLDRGLKALENDGGDS